MTASRRWTTAWGLVLAALLVACGNGGDEEAETGQGPTTTTEAPATTVSSTSPSTTRAGGGTTTSPPTSAAPACPANPIAGTPTDVTTGSGDFDGDGKTDTLRAYRLGSEWHLRAELAAGGAADSTVTPMGPVAVKALGGANLGKPAHVAFATVGTGAATVTVGLYFLKSCQMRPVVNEESAATFPIGATVGNVTGLECADYGNDGTQNLIWYRGSSMDGVTYRATLTIYAFSGESIATTAPGVVGPMDIASNNPQFPKYSALTCGGLTVP